MARYIDADALMEALNDAQSEFDYNYKGLGKAKIILSQQPTADVAPKSEVDWNSIPVDVSEALKQRAVEKAKTEVAREIFEKIKRSKVTLGHPAKIICFRATPTGEVEEIVESWVVPQSRIEELEKKYTGEQT